MSQSEEQRMLIETVKRFLDKEIKPYVEEFEKTQRPVTKELVKKLLPFGYIGGMLPESAGGAELTHTTYFQIIEELSRVWPSLRAMTSTINGVMTNIYEYGTQEQREKYVKPLLNVDATGFFALTEPNVGSDTASIEMRASLRGDKWIINGAKVFITNGVEGDIGIVIAQTDKSKGIDGIAAFIVEKGMGYIARPIEKMGTVCCSLAELSFEDVEVPKENMLGPIGAGLRLGLNFLNAGRVMVSFIAAGVAQACIDASVEYAKNRVQFGRPIGGFQLIQEKIADMVTVTTAMRQLSLHASELLDKGLPCKREASMAKVFATENVLRVAEQAMQIHGGCGYTKEFPVERLYRDIRHFTIAEGSSEIQRLIIGRDVLGISAFK